MIHTDHNCLKIPQRATETHYCLSNGATRRAGNSQSEAHPRRMRRDERYLETIAVDPILVARREGVPFTFACIFRGTHRPS